MKTPLIFFLSLVLCGLAPHLSADPKKGSKSGLDSLQRWSRIANDASGFDHGNARQQMGPGRSSRAMAIVHIAMFDVINALGGSHEGFVTADPGKGSMSIEAAIAQVAHDTLIALFPAQTATLDGYLAEDMAGIKNKNAKAHGIEFGKHCASAMMALRLGDGSEIPESFIGIDYTTSDLPGHWRMDPISQIPVALGAHWDQCAPFVVQSASQFRTPPFPAMTSAEYTASYNEVKALGGDGVTTPTVRNADQTEAGIYWAYDGTPSLCAPPRLYNQIALQIADQMGSDIFETARLMALVNIAMSDATLTCWESKYHYDIWRPVGGIREGDSDGNPATIADPNYSPLGAPASNVSGGKNFTPPFPAYPSGHASMGGALFQMLRRFYGTDNIPFTFVSDELNGITRDNNGNVRPLRPRSFSTLSQAEEENGQSRIYLGIHWSFDKIEGIALGNRVADYVFDNVFLPLPPRR